MLEDVSPADVELTVHEDASKVETKETSNKNVDVLEVDPHFFEHPDGVGQSELLLRLNNFDHGCGRVNYADLNLAYDQCALEYTTRLTSVDEYMPIQKKLVKIQELRSHLRGLSRGGAFCRGFVTVCCLPWHISTPCMHTSVIGTISCCGVYMSLQLSRVPTAL
jgi:hypothetical protein